MRSSSTATGLLLLLNVAALTNGLSHPPLEAPGASASAPSLVVPDARTAAGRDVSSDGGEGSSESRLELELAELKALRAQLASLAKEVDTRALRLATSVGPTEHSALADCDGPACVLRAVRRKARYAVEALRVNRRDWEEDREYLLPEQHRRRRHRRRQDASDSYPDLEPQGGVVEGFDLLVHRILLAILAVFTIQHMAIGAGLMLLCFAVLWCGSISRDALWKTARGGWRPWGPREGRIRLGDEEAVNWGVREKGTERLDEKHGEPGEGGRYWDEKAGFEEERYRDEYVSSWVEDVQVVEVDDNEGGYEEPPTLGDEIASFRSAVELVENMVAAAEERHQGRTDYRAS